MYFLKIWNFKAISRNLQETKSFANKPAGTPRLLEDRDCQTLRPFILATSLNLGLTGL